MEASIGEALAASHHVSHPNLQGTHINIFDQMDITGKLHHYLSEQYPRVKYTDKWPWLGHLTQGTLSSSEPDSGR